MPLGAIVANLLNNYVEPAPLTFWEKDPVAFVKVGPDDPPPWN